MYRYGGDAPLEELSGTISDLDGFLHRHLDTGFKTKWAGFWVPPYKYLDYYALKINGVWLDRSNLSNVEYGEKIVYHYELDTLKATETVEMLENEAGFRCTLRIENRTAGPKAVKTTLEAGVDIREKSRDLGPESYEVRTEESKTTVSNGSRELEIRGGESEGGEYIKTHQPGEKQRCLVPGEIVDRKEVGGNKEIESIFEFKADKQSHSSLESSDVDYSGKRGYLFKKCLESVRNQVYDRKGIGVIAGHPWFQSYWARDSFWTVLGLIDAGEYELSREILQNFAEKDLPGKISLNGGIEENTREDTYPLFVIAAENLREDDEITEEIEETCEIAMKQLELDDNVVEHDPEGTWMDTLQRSPAVEIQSLWLQAARLRNDERKEKLEKGLEKFQEEEMMKDTLGDDSSRAVNFAIPLMFGQIEEERAGRYLEKLNGEFTSKYGARTRSAVDPGYEAEGYHSGSVWGLTTCWAAAANAQYGKHREALNMIDRFSAFLDENQPGALPEVVNAETGDLLGCMEQAWSAGMVLHVLKSYIPEEGVPEK